MCDTAAHRRPLRAVRRPSVSPLPAFACIAACLMACACDGPPPLIHKATHSLPMPAYNAASAAVFVDGRRNWDKLLIEPRECGLVIVGLGRPVEAPVTDIFDDDWVNRSMGFNPAAAIYDGAKGRLLLSSPMFRGLVAVDVKAPVARLLGPHDFRAMSFIYAESEHAVYFVYPDWIVGRIPNAMGGALGTLAIEDVYSKQSFRLRANDPQLDGLSVSLHYDPDASLFLFVDTASIVRVFSPDTSGEEGPVLVSRGYLDLSVGGHPAGGASEPRAKIGRWGGDPTWCWSE